MAAPPPGRWNSVTGSADAWAFVLVEAPRRVGTALAEFDPDGFSTVMLPGMSVRVPRG
jgi:hypothetical protein